MTIAIARNRVAHTLGNGNIQIALLGRRQNPLIGLTLSQCRYKTSKSEVRRFGNVPDAATQKRNSIDTSSSLETLPSKSDLLVEKPIYPNIDLRPLSSSQLASSKKDLISTRPAPLDAIQDAPREPDGSVPLSERAKYLFRLGKSYVNFYKTGMKNIWSNYKEMRQIRQGLSPYSLQDVAKYGGSPSPKDPSKKIPQISRRDFELCLRTQHDLRKLIPFSLVFIICGEFTPLIIVALGSSVVPYTCRIPQQQISDLTRPERIWPKVDQEIAALAPLHDDPQGKYLWSTNGAEAHWRHEFLMAYRLGLSPFSKPIPILGLLYYQLFIKSKLHSYYNEILCDAILVRREGGYSKLTPEEVFDCARKYGLYTLGEELHKLQLQYKNELTPDKVLTQDLKRKLVPVLEGMANQMLNVDFRRLDPKLHHELVLMDLKKADNTVDYVKTEQQQSKAKKD